MCIPPFKRCFCILPLSFGVAFISVIEILVSVLNIIAVILYENLDETLDETELSKNQETTMTVKFKIASDILIIFAAILLLIGACRRRLAWLIPFLILGLFHMVLIGLYVFEKLMASATKEIIITQLLFLVYHGYIWWVVRSFYEEIKIEYETGAYSNLNE